jgi:hypothetical protein
VPKAWKFFEVKHSTWSTLENSLGCLISASTLATLTLDVALSRGDLMKGGEFRTFLRLEDYVYINIAT